ncbi:Ribosomal RNA small subunit methyltransferase D [Vibrio stylophorae]|uniref:Ribosomal RNA small subunit methyltransferase D n=1 Tax=Vibrio stylophorae TaxID=659351 RepID=A0ABN8DXV7_9VIBR|nr:16S rRNA (guanine(966)-N(2))-methyltransferase RsmD [Vibrio stylophorae]CAH0534750.1 Ribosomal RNA small subunit methyltransferase D [Vibrio stylophorae]
MAPRPRHISRSAPRAASQKPTGQIRIIAGQWRGRKLPVHDAQGLRPTTDRVKETLFNWLMQKVRGARCLDLFAGSGGLGFEALSRYASEVDFVEKESLAANQLKQNLASLKCEQGRVHHTDALQFLQQPAKPYDLVFLDPPFHQNLLADALALLQQSGWLHEGSWIYIETERDLALTLPAHWHCHRDKTAGQVHYRLYQCEQKNDDVL